MTLCKQFLLALSHSNQLMWDYVIFPMLIFIMLIAAGFLILAYSQRRVVAARGGIRKIYAELFDAIEKMPESEIISETVTSLKATYLNNSEKQCKIKVEVNKYNTFVDFYIRYHGLWVKIKKERFGGTLTGGEILWKIRANFPDCDF